ncbi:MAG: 23S rRNA (guanosine(2251)-2'-O)-methyltransferase RlmB [Clostridia bacterium]|nr:23S rRNA (guanosine(2251)-2'-O)-methyltransferase RlmB [Clostridia bacterium]
MDNYGKKDNYNKDHKPFRGKRFDKDARDDSECTVEGKNAVYEAVKSGREIDKILFAAGSIATVGNIIALARKNGILTQETDKRKLDKLSTTGSHQGIIALCAAVPYRTVDDMLSKAAEMGAAPLIVVCDGITDTHNLGAIIRSAEVSGAHGVIIPRKRSAGLNSSCAKAAAGALEHLPVAKLSSTLAAVEELHQKGLKVYAADMNGDSMYDADLTEACAIVIGSEGDGVSYQVKNTCDGVISIPQTGIIPSLNASNAAAVLLYEAYRQRRG